MRRGGEWKEWVKEEEEEEEEEEEKGAKKSKEERKGGCWCVTNRKRFLLAILTSLGSISTPTILEGLNC